MAALQTPDQQHQDMASSVAGSLQSKGHAVSVQDVIPVTAGTPIPNTPELDGAGAELIGKDLSHIVGATFGDLTTGTENYRTTESGGFLKTLKDRLFRKK